MTSHLVVTSEDESFVAAARYISELLDEGQVRTALADTPGSVFFANCEAVFSEARFEELLNIFIEKFSLLFSKAADGDLEACLNVCVHLINQVPPEAVAGAIQRLAQALTVKADGHAEQRLAALVQLFNEASDSQLKYHILLEAIAFSKATSQSTLLAPAIRNQLEAWVKEWQLTMAEQQKLYLAAADLLRANKKRKALLKEAYKLTIRALSTMQEASPQDLAGIKQIAVSAVAEFIRSPDVFQFDLLGSPAVTQLEGDPQQQPLYQLLQTLLAGDVKGLETLLGAHPEVLETTGSTAQDLQTKTRLMALLALTQDSSKVSFTEIQQHLGLADLSDVEEWLVRAMGKKLIEGQMDQVKQQVVITKSSYRTFGPEHWQILQNQLAAWKVSVEAVRELVSLDEASGLRAIPNGVRA